MRSRHAAKALAGVRPGTALDLYTERYGVHRGALRAATLAQLVIARVESGRELSASQYAARWGIKPRAAFEHRRYAQEVFGPEWRSVVEQLAVSIEREYVARNQRFSAAAVVRLAIPA